MQQEPAPSRSPRPQRDPALSHTPTMPPPETPAEGQPSSPSPSPTEQSTEEQEEEFQFLHCQRCKVEAKCPKLLPCLHTLCSGCLEAPVTKCPICQEPWPPGSDLLPLDNVFFESLQRRLSVYRQVMDARAVCIRCKELADFWCFECEQLLCATCFEAHQWFLKHEARPLAELRSKSVHEFLDGTRKSNNIFCSNPNHRSPALTSIYCRGCCKPLCCSCALLDSDHSALKCDISAEIQQRQEELEAMTQALQEQDGAFATVHAQLSAAIGQLARARADTEELIQARVRQVVALVLAEERELLEGVTERYQRDYEKLASRLSSLDAVLQRIRTGGALVQRMKRYASDQEVLDMHSFLREALCRLRREEPQNLQAAVRTDGFDEFRTRLQDLVSSITQRTDAVLSRRASPEAASTRRDSSDIESPEETQRVQMQAPAQALGLAEAQPVAVVQSVPGAHPVPMYAFSIKDSSYREEVSNTATPQKRKSCQTQCPRKLIKMESEEEKDARLALSSPEQPRPSTSKAVSPPRLDGLPNPRSPLRGTDFNLPNSNHATSSPGEAEERVVVISSSEDSDAEHSCTEPTESAQPPPSLPAQSLLRARGASCPRRARRASRLPHGTCRPPTWLPQATTSDAASPSQPAEHQEHAAVHRGISHLLHRAQRAIRLRHIHHLPLRLHHGPKWPWSSQVVQATTPAPTGPPSHLAQEQPAHLYNAIGLRLRVRGARRSRSRSLRGSYLSQWLSRFFALPLSSMASQLGASSLGESGGGRAPQALVAGVPLGDSDRAPVESPQVPPEASPVTFPPATLGPGPAEAGL
ncbi:protein PML isoform X2 [Lemur catta]|uniref:protein PML isoform X2 n=1 Tax=Lemur catta TaxID=9447 RepID=UPI001E26A50A|nr:protein PML isoform X2 [Lemur catta]